MVPPPDSREIVVALCLADARESTPCPAGLLNHVYTWYFPFGSHAHTSRLIRCAPSRSFINLSECSIRSQSCTHYTKAVPYHIRPSHAPPLNGNEPCQGYSGLKLLLPFGTNCQQDSNIPDTAFSVQRVDLHGFPCSYDTHDMLTKYVCEKAQRPGLEPRLP